MQAKMRVHLRGLPRHSKDDVYGRGRYEARRSLRCTPCAEVDYGFCQQDEMRRDGAIEQTTQQTLFMLSYIDMIVRSIACCTGSISYTPIHTADGNFCIRRSHY